MSDSLIKKLEILQNNIWRGTLGIHKTAKMSSLKNALGIYKIKDLYMKYQIIVLKLIPRHPITQAAYDYFKTHKYNRTFGDQIRKTTTELLKDESFETIEDLHCKLNSALNGKFELGRDEILLEKIRNIIHHYNSKNIRELNELLRVEQRT